MLKTRNAELESKLEATEKLVIEQAKKTVKVQTQMLRLAEDAMEKEAKSFEQLKKYLAKNLDLERKVGNLQIDVELARQEGLIQQNRALSVEQERMEEVAANFFLNLFSSFAHTRTVELLDHNDHESR